MESKVLWKSKTLWASLVVAVAAFFPSVQALVASNPEIVGTGLALVFGVLRLVTKGKIDIK
jgi:xanthine/uracil permease